MTTRAAQRCWRIAADALLALGNTSRPSPPPDAWGCSRQRTRWLAHRQPGNRARFFRAATALRRKRPTAMPWFCWSSDDQRRPMVDRYAASIYRQGEEAAAAGEHPFAADSSPGCQCCAGIRYPRQCPVRRRGPVPAGGRHRCRHRAVAGFSRAAPGSRTAVAAGAQLVANLRRSSSARLQRRRAGAVHDRPGDAEVRRRRHIPGSPSATRAGGRTRRERATGVMPPLGANRWNRAWRRYSG